MSLETVHRSAEGPEGPYQHDIRIDESAPSDRLIVHTSNSRYELTVTDPATGCVQVHGGHYFPTPTPAHVLCMREGDTARAPEIGVGSKLELIYDDGRVVRTSRVRAIERIPH